MERKTLKAVLAKTEVFLLFTKTYRPYKLRAMSQGTFDKKYSESYAIEELRDNCSRRKNPIKEWMQNIELKIDRIKVKKLKSL